MNRKKQALSILLILLLSLTLVSCGSDTATPTPFTFPQSVGSPPFLLKVDQKQNILTYTLSCTTIDHTTKANVTLQSGQGSPKVLNSVTPANCSAIDQELNSGPILDITQLHEGDKFWVLLEQIPAGYSTPQGTQKTWMAFKVGTNGKLYSGDPYIQS